MNTPNTITLSVQRVLAVKQALRTQIEALRTMPIDVVAQERADIEGRLRTLVALGLVNMDEETEIYYQAEAARQEAEEA